MLRELCGADMFQSLFEKKNKKHALLIKTS